MGDSYLTRADVDAYGAELLDVSQRAALHAVAPHLMNLEQQNQELQRRLAQEARRNLDAAVERAIPNYREVDRDPRWHRWLTGIDALTGRPRQHLLNIAIQEGDANRITTFFRSFQQEAGDAPASAASSHYGRARSSGNRQIYSRDQVKALYESHRRGEWSGREQEWSRLEHDIIRAGAEGRITGGVDVAGK